MSFLLDTNVISELRKGAHCDRGVSQWRRNHVADDTYLSVLTTGEIRKGIESCRSKEPNKARTLEIWLRGIELDFGKRILPVTAKIADLWGRIPAGANLSAIDGLLAATSEYYDFTVVTRNERDFQRSGVDYINPFSD